MNRQRQVELFRLQVRNATALLNHNKPPLVGSERRRMQRLQWRFNKAFPDVVRGGHEEARKRMDEFVARATKDFDV